ncbi:MAG: hypothetical protein PHC61_11740 [Chitinivibrionales bacterium]|nr:hypothetical protein [Chitinivibrionales bacterium]
MKRSFAIVSDLLLRTSGEIIRLFIAMFLLVGATALPAWCLAWNGGITTLTAGEDSQTCPAYIPDVNKPVRAVMIFDYNVTFSDMPNWRAVAAEYNCMMIDFGGVMPGGSTKLITPETGVARILLVLSKASVILPAHPEIQYACICFYGFSATAATVSRLSAEPNFATRTLAVVSLHEIDDIPWMPPVGVPHLFLSSQGSDAFSSLTTNVEGVFTPNYTHDTLARSRQATALKAPMTVVAHVGQYHGGDKDANIISLWLQDVFSLRLPLVPPTTTMAVMPSWQNNAGWLGTYDVVLNTNTAPWGNEQRMINVVTAPRASYTDPRPYIWLPNQHFADIWKAYATTGIMPAFTPLTAVKSKIASARPLMGGARETVLLNLQGKTIGRFYGVNSLQACSAQRAPGVYFVKNGNAISRKLVLAR